MPRLGLGQQGLIPVLSERGVTTTASPLYYVSHSPELSLVRDQPQWASFSIPAPTSGRSPDNAPTASAQPFGNDPEPYDPDSAR